MMKPAKFVVLCLLIWGGHSQVVLGQDARVTVKVIDKQKSPVFGMVILNPGRQRLGKTNPKNGEYTFSHTCQTGQTLKAEPEDGAKYYDSEEQVCRKVVVLEVFPRPQTTFGSADFFHIQKVNTPPGTIAGTVYAGVFGIVTDKVESVMAGDKGKCKLTIDKKFEVAYYNTKMADWKSVTRTLPQTGAQQDDVIYYFPSSCENAWQQIGEIKKQTNLELKAGVLDYYTINSREIGMAVVEATKPPK